MTKVFSPLTLPSDYDEMEEFIIGNKVKLTEHVISSVHHALINKLSHIEVFNFKDSEYIVILDRSMFQNNVENIYQFYIETEKYELCSRIVKLKQLLEQHE